MRPASIQPVADPFDRPLRRRAATMSLVILLHLLLVLVLTRLAENPPRQFGSALKPLTVDLLPAEKAEQAQARAAKKTARTAAKARRAPAPAPQPAQPQVTPPPPVTSDVWSHVVPLTHEQLASADIAKLPSHAEEAAQGSDSGSGRTGMAGDSVGRPGGGPHGETLYDADWYRRPTNAELAAYIPPNAPRVGWGLIACQTMPGYKVDNCVELGQSPQGSGLARAVREAAWQFRVLPPRINGKPLVGAWVSIRIDYTEHDAK